ncbi:MAG TPA: thioredoxin family protein [Puia sp.]|nr:thioredoxin family protein [Puia sp.]
MNRIILAAALCFSVTGKSFSQSIDTNNTEYKGIKFEQDLNWMQVKAKAKAENKYIFVDVYATWCGPCKRMDKEVYTNRRVGDAMKEKFIPVKVQMDSTQQDNEQIRNWYAEARRLTEEYKISGYPSFLFFTPDGKLVHKDGGFKDTVDFVRLINQASDPRKAQYYAQLEDYKKDKKDYPLMGGLAEFTKKLIGDKDLASTIAKDYKENYLDKQTGENVCTRENLDFIAEFYNLINSKDKLFELCYHQQNRIDQIKDHKGWAKFQVNQTITREEIETKVLKNGKAVVKYPDWKNIQNTIAEKYSAIDAKLLVLTYKVFYYRGLYLNWPLWAKYKDEMIKEYPLKPPYGLAVYIEINGWGGAWAAFMECDDKKVLEKSLQWADLALKLDGEKNRAAYLDTKANLLYKLGRKREALSLEKEAVALSDSYPDIVDTYKKMQAGIPTWLQP